MINIVSDRDFGRYDQKMSQKQTLSDIVSCNLMVNKIGLQVNLKSKLKKTVQIARTNKDGKIKEFESRKEEISLFKIDKSEKARI